MHRQNCNELEHPDKINLANIKWFLFSFIFYEFLQICEAGIAMHRKNLNAFEYPDK